MFRKILHVPWMCTDFASCHYSLNNIVWPLFTQHLHYIRYYKSPTDDLKYINRCVRLYTKLNFFNVRYWVSMDLGIHRVCWKKSLPSTMAWHYLDKRREEKSDMNLKNLCLGWKPLHFSWLKYFWFLVLPEISRYLKKEKPWDGTSTFLELPPRRGQNHNLKISELFLYWHFSPNIFFFKLETSAF
jgi:hypothetical protein